MKKTILEVNYFFNFLGFTNEKQQNLWQNLPLVYTYNDYDYCGYDSGATSDGKSAINTAYRKMFSHYPLEATEGLYHSFKIGAVLFIVTDTRTFLSEKDKTFFGETQKTWIKNKISNAVKDPTIGGIILTTTQVWIYNKTEYEGNLVQQDYTALKEAFLSDKEEIGKAISDSGINFDDPVKAGFKSLLMIIGEEMLAFDDGLNNPNGKFPTVVCGNIDGSGSCKGGPYSYSSFTQSNNQYCRFIITPNMTDTPKVCFNIIGNLRMTNEEANTEEDKTVFVYNTCYRHQFKGFNTKCSILATEKVINAAITLGINVFLFVVFFLMLYKITAKSFNFTTLDPETS